MTRTISSIKNIVASFTMGLLVIVINFIAQKYFVETLGVEYLGINGLFTNIISMLMVAELGIGAAVVYHMYAPLHRRRLGEISSLMSFYKKAYRVIALLIVVAGGVLIPFLPIIVGETSLKTNTIAIYLLFITNAAVSYLLSYKRSILYADQKNYIINLVHLGVLICLNILQILVLVATQNYYLYLVLRIVFTLLENVILNSIVNRSYALDYSPGPIGANLRSDIFTKVKGLVFHKAGAFLVLGSSNIIISIMLGVVMVGLYSNYLLILTSLQALFGQVSTAIRASVGNLLVDVGGEKSFVAFCRLQFANHWLVTIAVSVFFIASNSLIVVWLGEKYTFNIWVVAAMSLSLYLLLARTIFSSFKEAAGIFHEDRFVPLVEAGINIVASVILIQFMGLAGAFLGTALSSLTLYCYSYPKFVYKGVLGGNFIEYFRYMSVNFIAALSIITTAYFTSRLIKTESLLLQLASDTSIAVAIPCLIMWLMYRKSPELSYYLRLMKKITRKLKRILLNNLTKETI